MRRFDFQLKLICFGTFLVAISVGVSWVIAYQQSKLSLERSLARELLAIVNSLAPQVDGDLLDRSQRGKAGGPDRLEELDLIRKQLVRVKEANALKGPVSPLYILRKASDFSSSRELESVVLSDRNEGGVAPTRSRYTARPHSLAALEGSGAVTGIYTDSDGVWISAAAPVRDSQGHVTGILQADRPVNSFYEDARNQVLAILPGAIVSLIIATILSVLLARSIARPVRRLLRATELLAGGDLDPTVDIRRNDELGDLAEGFKRMAREMKSWRDTIAVREGDLVRAGRDARAGSSAKGEFLATMSHEIRTPMNAILGFNHLLLDTNLDVRQRSFAETVAASGESLLKILNDVLDFSKIEAGKLTLETLNFDPREVIETSLDLLAVAARSKGIEIASRIDGTVPAWLRGDPGRLRQVLVNLIGNGVKFTVKGEVLVEAKAKSDSATRDGRDLVVLELSVKDTGAGMSPDLASKLFEPFMQADSSTTRKHGGTGLGLAISKRLVEMMGGSISVDSRPGEGSVFTFTAAFERATQTTAPDAPPLPLPAGARILVADDNAAVREFLSREIKDLGLLPAGEPGGKEALRALRSEAEAGRPFALAILDASMPEVDGLAVARAIKEDPKIAGVRAVLLRTLGDRLTDEKLAEAGIAAFVMKPVKRRSLADAIATALTGEGGARTEGVAGSVRVRDPASRSSRSLAAQLAPPERRLRILLAEDSLVNQRLSLLFLEKLGYQASVVPNGAKAVEATASAGFDLVLMDCQMPEMDGYEAARAIRDRELKQGAAGHRTTIIALTANAMADDRRKCLDSGMDDYLRKPIRISELRETLARCEDILK